MTGIGLLVVWSQLGPLLGIEGRVAQYSLAEVLGRIKPASVLVGLVAALAVWGYPKLKIPGQPILVALALGTGTYHLLAHLVGADQLGPTVGVMLPATTAEPAFRAAWGMTSAGWLFSTAIYVLPYAAFLALQAIMNAAVTATAVGNILGAQSDVNRTLKAQGVANMACGLLAALPVSTNAALSVPAAKQGASARVVALSCAILFVLAFSVGQLLVYLPLAALAGILIMTGLGMVDRWATGLALQVWRSAGRDRQLTLNLALVAAVAAAFFVGSVPLALLVGAVLAMVLLALNLSSAASFAVQDGRGLSSNRVWPAEQAAWLARRRASIAVFRPRGGLFFGTADQLSRSLGQLVGSAGYCLLDLTKVTALDATACQLLAASARKMAGKGMTTVLAGLDPSGSREKALVALGLNSPDPARYWFADVDHALEWVEADMLKQEWPAFAQDAPVPLADTPLTKDVPSADIAQLRVSLTPGSWSRVHCSSAEMPALRCSSSTAG